MHALHLTSLKVPQRDLTELVSGSEDRVVLAQRRNDYLVVKAIASELSQNHAVVHLVCLLGLERVQSGCIPVIDTSVAVVFAIICLVDYAHIIVPTGYDNDTGVSSLVAIFTILHEHTTFALLIVTSQRSTQLLISLG